MTAEIVLACVESITIHQNARETSLVQDPMRLIELNLGSDHTVLKKQLDKSNRSYFLKTRMSSYEQAKPKDLAHPMAKHIYSECFPTTPLRGWLLSKTSNETVRHSLSFGMYLQYPRFPLSQSVRIQLPLKTRYAVNAPCPSSANAKMMSKMERKKDQDEEIPRT